MNEWSLFLKLFLYIFLIRIYIHTNFILSLFPNIYICIYIFLSHTHHSIIAKDASKDYEMTRISSSPKIRKPTLRPISSASTASSTSNTSMSTLSDMSVEISPKWHNTTNILFDSSGTSDGNNNIFLVFFLTLKMFKCQFLISYIFKKLLKILYAFNHFIR